MVEYFSLWTQEMCCGYGIYLIPILWPPMISLCKLEDLVIMFWLEQWLSVVTCDNLVCRSCGLIFAIVCVF